VANWSAHQNDTSFILFRDLYDLLERAGKREAIVGYTPTSRPRSWRASRRASAPGSPR
jgi:hypothetical protein